MRKISLAIAATALLAVSGASASPYVTRDLAAAKAITPSGSAFTQALHGEYVALGEEALAESDHLHAHRYVRKAMAAGGGEAVAPEDPSTWLIPRRARGELRDAHGQLLTALDGGAREANPQPAARAQAMFDCWVEEEHEDVWDRAPGVTMYQPDDIARCKDGFFAAMRALEGEAPPPPAPAAQEFIIFFAFDRSNLDAAAISAVEGIVSAANANTEGRVNLTGFTDRAGSEEYNLGLSERRAQAVADALVARGIPATRIVAAWRGESQPRVPTSDGVANPQNRRVEVRIQ